MPRDSRSEIAREPSVSCTEPLRTFIVPVANLQRLPKEEMVRLIAKEVETETYARVLYSWMMKQVRGDTDPIDRFQYDLKEWTRRKKNYMHTHRGWQCTIIYKNSRSIRKVE